MWLDDHDTKKIHMVEKEATEYILYNNYSMTANVWEKFTLLGLVINSLKDHNDTLN